jgi:hypothetical protein
MTQVSRFLTEELITNSTTAIHIITLMQQERMLTDLQSSSIAVKATILKVVRQSITAMTDGTVMQPMVQ